MSQRPLRPCSRPGCRNLSRTGRCPDHPRHQERRKDPEQAAYYNSAEWQKLRAQVRAEEPLCRMCKAEGRVSATEIIDHEDGDWTHDARSNLRGLCRPCNDSHTGRQHRRKRQELPGRG